MTRLKCGCEYNGNGYLIPCKQHDYLNKDKNQGC